MARLGVGLAWVAAELWCVAPLLVAEGALEVPPSGPIAEEGSHAASGSARGRLSQPGWDHGSQQVYAGLPPLAPRFWLRPWFLGSAIASLGLTALGLVRLVEVRRFRKRLYQAEQQHALELERMRVARDLHDQLGANLTRITLLSELLRRDLGQPDRAKRHLDQIAATTRESARAVDEIVWAINPQKDRLGDLVSYLCAYAEEFLQPAGVRCRLDIPPGLPSPPVSSDIRHAVLLVLKETLNNLVKHAHATEFRLQLRLEGSRLILRLEDNGTGFRLPVAETNGNGLANIRHRVTSLHGSIQIVSRLQRGTSIQVSIPLQSGTRPGSISGPIGEETQPDGGFSCSCPV